MSEPSLSTEEVASAVERVQSEDLYWFPVRHHSPRVARHLESAILERKPKIVFIEGPSDANDLVQHIVDAKTKPPVAIYSSYRDDENTLGLAGSLSPSEDIPLKVASWYPLLSYSPEYVAMQAAKKVKSRVVFIDLPYRGQLPVARSVEPADVEDELIEQSDFYQSLASAAGYQTFSEAWDSLFEAPDRDRESFRRELLAFCAAARASSTRAGPEHERTLMRERWMWKTINEELERSSTSAHEAVVVVGGFHAFLDRCNSAEAPELPDGTVFTTVVPYSFFRASEASGYGAGNRAPQLYQSWWDLARKGREDELVEEHIVAVMKAARKKKRMLSSADAIASAQTSRMLARLRGRARPILEDMHDALITCCAKGDPKEEAPELLMAMDDVAIGTKIGRVTPALGRLPILNDFYEQIEVLGLSEVMGRDRTLELVLDTRKEAEHATSIFLHRVRFLDVPLGGTQTTVGVGAGSGVLFSEPWTLKWSPEVESRIIERNLYGDSIEAAALSRLKEKLASVGLDAGQQAEMLLDASRMELPDLVLRAEESCGEAIDTDSRLVSLARALNHLMVLDRYALHRGLTRDVLEELITRCFKRACFAVPEVTSVPEEERPEVVNALLLLSEVVLRDDTGAFDRVLLVSGLRSGYADAEQPYMRGFFLGLLAELRDVPPEELAKEIEGYAQLPQDRMIQAGEFLHGALRAFRTALMLAADKLIAAIDSLLKAAEWDAFLTMLPGLRGAFEQLHERQRTGLAMQVAERYGLKEVESIQDLSTSVEAQILFSEIDQKVAQIMKEWSL